MEESTRLNKKLYFLYNITMNLPTKIRIESSSNCQLKCPSCPTATGAIRQAIKPQHLSYDNFVKLLNNNTHIKDVELSNYGEIFLNPQLYWIMRYAHSQGVRLHADNGVNFNFVDEDVMYGLVGFEFNSMTISIDGVTEATYSKYRVGGNLKKVLKNIEHLNSIKKKSSIDYPKLTWQFIVFGHNEHELATAREMAKELNMDFYAKLSWDEGFSPVQDTKLVQIQINAPYASRKEYEETTGENYCRGICQQLWNAPVINSDGTMLGCCRNFWGDFGPNVFDVGLEASLSNAKMDYAKMMLLGLHPARNDIPCTTCDIYLDLVKSGKYLTPEEIERENRTLKEKLNG